MNEFLTAMSNDMGIKPYENESDDSFTYRLCYSALGQWCLKVASDSYDGLIGTTKSNQTIIMNELLKRYAELFPDVIKKINSDESQNTNLPVHIRKVYEETGYLLTNENNHNQLAKFGRNIQVGNSTLFIGLPNEQYSVNGLGVFTSTTRPSCSSQEFLIRDKLDCKEYLQTKFDLLDFYKKEIDIEELQFFNPLSKVAPSKSWFSKIHTDYSVARKSEIGPFYRVIQEVDGSLLFADEITDIQTDRLTAYEYRRLYFALKAYYENPLKACVFALDGNYSRLKVEGHLPNREYYYLLLLSWPLYHSFDKVNFLIKNDFIPEITNKFNDIGIAIQGGNSNV